jgi:hypothetical protein
MGSPITLFSGYSQRENRTTNYCLLLLKMIYEENPKFLAEVLVTLIGEEARELVGVKFYQQEKKAASVLDGLILQTAFTIYLETKNYDWFYDSQLEKHLHALNEADGFKLLIALGNFQSDEEDHFQNMRELCQGKYKKSVAFAKISFEEFIQSILKLQHLPKNVADAASDLRAYLDEENLLPSWQNWLDVVNCAGIPEDVLDRKVYICPASGGAYSHYRCKYFGMYRNKRVEVIAEINAVVDVNEENAGALKWRNNTATTQTELIAAAVAKVQQCRNVSSHPRRVFLLGQLYETDFRKDTPGGMQGSKIYFDIGQLRIADAHSLADALRDKTWSNYLSEKSSR